MSEEGRNDNSDRMNRSAVSKQRRGRLDPVFLPTARLAPICHLAKKTAERVSTPLSSLHSSKKGQIGVSYHKLNWTIDSDEGVDQVFPRGVVCETKP